MNGTESVNALDPRSFNELKRLSKDNSPEAIRAAARQFEALFLQMVLKSMREATPKGGIFDSDQSRLYQSLLDQQLAMQLANGGGTGFGDAIARQLGAAPERAASATAAPAPAASHFDTLAAFAARQAANAAAELAADGKALPAFAADLLAGEAVAEVPDAARSFVNRVWPHALAASRETGIPAHFMVAQAALETGWGKAELRHADGSSSHNLFNIKAGRSWKGETVALDAVEYRNGEAYREPSRFRAYGSYGEAFRDYARLLTENPRYEAVLGEHDAAGFARGLQRAGYATDPMYADKLERIIAGNTLRSALSGS